MTDEARRAKDRKRKNKLYAESETFREQAKARARARYTPKKKPSTRGRNKPRALPINGELHVCVGMGVAADMLGVHKTTLRGYDDRGVIPQNRLVDSSGRRWYPKAFIELLRPIFENQSTERQPLWRLRGEVQRAWAEALEEGKCPVVQDLERTSNRS